MPEQRLFLSKTIGLACRGICKKILYSQVVIRSLKYFLSSFISQGMR